MPDSRFRDEQAPEREAPECAGAKGKLIDAAGRPDREFGPERIGAKGISCARHRRWRTRWT